MLVGLAVDEEQKTVDKQAVLEIVDHLPEPIDPERLIGELYLREKLDRAEAAIAGDDVVSHEEVVERSQQWFA